MIVREATDLDVLELSLIENLQREDLNPIEEAQAYARLAGEFGLRQEDIAQKVGRSRAAVANSLRLLDLHPQVQVWVTQGLLSVGHAKVLLGLKAQEEQLAVAETVLRRSSPVRDAERLVARQLGTIRRRKRVVSPDATSAVVADLQNRLQQHLGTRVIFHHGEKRGRIEIEYYGNDDLQRVLNAIGFPRARIKPIFHGSDLHLEGTALSVPRLATTERRAPARVPFRAQRMRRKREGSKRRFRRQTLGAIFR